MVTAVLWPSAVAATLPKLLFKSNTGVDSDRLAVPAPVPPPVPPLALFDNGEVKNLAAGRVGEGTSAPPTVPPGEVAKSLMSAIATLSKFGLRIDFKLCDDGEEIVPGGVVLALPAAPSSGGLSRKAGSGCVLRLCCRRAAPGIATAPAVVSPSSSSSSIGSARSTPSFGCSDMGISFCRWSRGSDARDGYSAPS